jgi:nuclear pore complex protein Nup155
LASKAPEPPFGEEPREVVLKAETWKLVYECDDEVFHSSLYDWLFETGRGQQLLDINSTFVLNYLIRKASNSITHADLLWQYYGRRELYFEAAEVLYELAQCTFKLTLERRLEYLSRAKGYCNSYGPMAARQKMNELGHTVQEELDVAVIQDDVLRRIKEDARISVEKKEVLVAQLDDNLISLSDVSLSNLWLFL